MSTKPGFPGRLLALQSRLKAHARDPLEFSDVAASLIERLECDCKWYLIEYGYGHGRHCGAHVELMLVVIIRSAFGKMRHMC